MQCNAMQCHATVEKERVYRRFIIRLWARARAHLLVAPRREMHSSMQDAPVTSGVERIKSLVRSNQAAFRAKFARVVSPADCIMPLLHFSWNSRVICRGRMEGRFWEEKRIPSTAFLLLFFSFVFLLPPPRPFFLSSLSIIWRACTRWWKIEQQGNLSNKIKITPQFSSLFFFFF